MPMGIYIHKPLSEETKRKISEAVKKNPPSTTYKKGHETWNKNLKGIHLSPESEFKKGIIPQNSFIFTNGESKFKGTPKEYKQLHSWVNRNLGKPKICSNCKGFFTGRKIHWANKSGEYKRDLEDWVSLCAKCHYLYDNQESRKTQYYG